MGTYVIRKIVYCVAVLSVKKDIFCICTFYRYNEDYDKLKSGLRFTINLFN